LAAPAGLLVLPVLGGVAARGRGGLAPLGLGRLFSVCASS
jgi:hypothetical protein